VKRVKQLSKLLLPFICGFLVGRLLYPEDVLTQLFSSILVVIGFISLVGFSAKLLKVMFKRGRS